MSPTGGRDDRERLAAHIDARQQALGVPWTQVIKESGLTKEGLRKIREGLTGSPRPQTKRGLERALRWALGSVDKILAGGDPEPLTGQRSGSGLTTTEMVAEAHRDLDRLQELREELRRRAAAAEGDPGELERSVIALRIVQDRPDESGAD